MSALPFKPDFLERLHSAPWPALGVRGGMVSACNAAAAALFGLPAGDAADPVPAGKYLSPKANAAFRTLLSSGGGVARVQSEWMGKGCHVNILARENGQAMLVFIPRGPADGDHMPEFMMRLDSYIRKQLTPLMASLGQMVSETGPQDKKMLWYLSEARRSVFSLLRMSNNLRDSAKCFGTMDYFDPELCDLANLCRRAAKMAGLAAGYSGVKVVFTCPEESLVAAVDPDKLERLLFNLLSNAVRHSKEGGTVRVSLAHEEDQITLCVKDEGAGMGEEQLAGVFDEYRRFTMDDPLPGLGLPLAAAYAEQHGGTIFIASEAGAGTTVTVTFPYSTVGDIPVGTPPPDYTGEFPHFMVEMSDLPGIAPLYGSRAELDALLEKYV